MENKLENDKPVRLTRTVNLYDYLYNCIQIQDEKEGKVARNYDENYNIFESMTYLSKALSNFLADEDIDFIFSNIYKSIDMDPELSILAIIKKWEIVFDMNNNVLAVQDLSKRTIIKKNIINDNTSEKVNRLIQEVTKNK